MPWFWEFQRDELCSGDRKGSIIDEADEMAIRPLSTTAISCKANTNSNVGEWQRMKKNPENFCNSFSALGFGVGMKAFYFIFLLLFLPDC